MVFMGLVVSSCGFFIPAMVAFVRKQRIHALRAGALAVSSIAYHSTTHPVAHAIDACVAHGYGAAYWKESFVRFRAHGRLCDAIALGNLTGAGLIYLVKSKFNKHVNSRYWHLGLHVFAQATWVYYIVCTGSGAGKSSD